MKRELFLYHSPKLKLPIDGLLASLQDVVRAGRSFVLQAPPGTGKTTRVPPALAAVLPGQILVVEPRRVAARAAARRVAAEYGGQLGSEVGYEVRFDRNATRSTQVLFLTPGILLQRIQRDPMLESVAAVIFDEVHERSLQVDLGLALCREVRDDLRPELVLVAMSATLSAGLFAEFLSAEVFGAEGQAYPVEVEHIKRALSPDFRDLAQRAAEQTLEELSKSRGDTLVFMPGVREIGATIELLRARCSLEILALHGRLSNAEQDRALQPGEGRRIIVATNVAESSLTIPRVDLVIDAGLARQPSFDARLGLNRLETTRICRESATQRAGRAGRVRPGRCMRLWTEFEDRQLVASRQPEVQRVELSDALLQLACWGVRDPSDFGWLQRPPEAAIRSARQLLYALGALDGECISAFGEQLLELPLSPRLGALALHASRLGAAREGALAAALIAEGKSRSRMVSSYQHDSDLWEGIQQLRKHPQFDVQRAAKQIEAKLKQSRRREDPAKALRQALAVAYGDRVALRRADDPRRAQLCNGHGVRLSGRSGVRSAPLFVCVDIEAKEQRGRAEAVVHTASAVDPDWLPLTEVRICRFNSEREQVEVWLQQRYQALVLKEQRVSPLPGEGESLLIEQARMQPERALGLDSREFVQLRARLEFAASHCSEFQSAQLDEAKIEQLVKHCAVGRRSFAEMRQAAPEMVRALLGYTIINRLKEWVPEEIQLASGRWVRLDYRGVAPSVAAPIQEFFGSAQGPSICKGGVALQLELLAPNQRPQQITTDLASFWVNTYPELRKELRGRYAKHAWPKDPLSAQAHQLGRRRRS